MSDVPAGPGWWQAQDGRWYGPEHHPDPAHRSAHGADPTNVAPGPGGDDPTVVAPAAVGGGPAPGGDVPPPGWWQAQDGQWYGPEHHPDPAHRAAYAGGATPPPGGLPPADPASGAGGGSKLPLVIGAVVVAALLVVGAIVLLGGGDDDDDVATGATTTETTEDGGTTTETTEDEGATTTSTTTTTRPTTTTTDSGPGQGSNDVEISLFWIGDADLDLRVTDPNGEQISFTGDATSSSGMLEEDVRPSPGDDGEHEEFVFWPDGDAPDGTYTVEVRNLSMDEVDFEVIAIVNGSEVLFETGTVPGSGEEFTFEVG